MENQSTKIGMVAAEEVTEVKEVKGTPFAVLSKGNRHRIVLGDQIICATEFDTYEDAVEYLAASLPWDIFINTIFVSIQKHADYVANHSDVN